MIILVVVRFVVGGATILVGLLMLRGRREASRVLPGVVTGLGLVCVLAAAGTVVSTVLTALGAALAGRG